MYDRVHRQHYHLKCLVTSIARSSLISTFHLSEQYEPIETLHRMLEQLSTSIEQVQQYSTIIVDTWQDFHRLVSKRERLLRQCEINLEQIENDTMHVETYSLYTTRGQACQLNRSD
jgi:biotin-(acetyl-CoA carboxylase) ligase